MQFTIRGIAALGLVAGCIACGGPGNGGLVLTSPAFEARGEIPTRHTCLGDEISPPLEWTGLPEGTQSLVLIVDDPDAPGRTAVHWLLYNIPPTLAVLPETEWGSGLPDGVLAGRNDFDRTEYGGPCPPSGRHRYVHTLYALDTMLPDLNEPVRGKLERAMESHVLAETQLIGTFGRGE